MSKKLINNNSAEEKLRIVKMRIQALKTFRLFGSILYQFGLFLESEESFNGPMNSAYVVFNTNTNKYDIHFSKSFLDNLTIENITFVLLHEMLHVLHKHITRRGFRDPVMWNLAADHVINVAIRTDANNKAFDENVILPESNKFKPFFIKYFDTKNKLITVEEAYAYLIENATYTKIKICSKCGSSDQGNGQGKSKDCCGDGDSDGKGKGKQCPGCNGSDSISGEVGTFHDPKTGQKVDVSLDIQYPTASGKSGADEVNDNADRAADQIQSDMRTFRDAFPDNNSRGSGSCVGEMLDKLLEVTIPIDVLLKKAVTTKMRPSDSARSWRSLHKQYQGIGLTSPGKGVEENIETGVYIIDTSGSVSSHDLQIAGGAVLNCAEIFADMYVVKHADRLYSKKFYEYGIDDIDELTMDLLDNSDRGGTSHDEVFEYVEELFIDRNGLGLIMIITDYYSNVTELFDSGKYTWCGQVPVCIMLTPGSDPKMVPDRVDKDVIVLPEMENN